MSEQNERKVFKLVVGDDRFWVDLRELSEILGWELGQTLKACFVLGWDLLSQRANFSQEENENDHKKLE